MAGKDLEARLEARKETQERERLLQAQQQEVQQELARFDQHHRRQRPGSVPRRWS